jgi:hypothetical protein
MFTFMFFFLGLAACMCAGLVCLALIRSMRESHSRMISQNDKDAWHQLKNAMMDLYWKYESKETPTQKSLRSWATTLVICSGLCLLGIALEIKYDQTISTDRICDGLVGTQTVTVSKMVPSHARLHKASVKASSSKSDASIKKDSSDNPSMTK